MAMTLNAASPGWLHHARFDRWFIFGIALIAICTALTVTAYPSLFLPILFLDLWLLGYHHVVSTYTRLCFDKQSAQENKFFLIQLPIICLCVVSVLAHTFGIWVLTTIYLYWQWFHYTRQSWGVSQAYRRSEIDEDHNGEQFSKWVFYSVPVVGILYRMYQGPETFLFAAVWTPNIPLFIVQIAAAGALVLVGLWIVTRVQAARQGRLPFAHTAYMISHIVIFMVGYVLIEDITYGWLAINIWHNAQYVLFVWLANNKRYEGKISERPTFIASLSQSKNWKRYFGLCLGLSTLAYLCISLAAPMLALIGLAPMIIIYQTINFHHYIVDSLIWKQKRKKPATPAAA